MTTIEQLEERIRRLEDERNIRSLHIKMRPGKTVMPYLSGYALATQGVTNGNAHDHNGGDGAQIDHGGLAGLGDDDHTQYLLATGGRIATVLNSQGDVRADVNEDGEVTIGTSRIELGKTGRAAASTPYIDFHSSANSPDYDARIIASGGNAAVGAGILDVYAAGGFRLAGWQLISGDGGLTVVIDGAGAPPTVGWKAFIPVPYKCYVHYADFTADVVGSCSVSITSFSSFPTGNANIGVAVLTGAQRGAVGLTGTIFNAGDVIGFYVNSASTLTRVTLTVRLVKVP